MNLVKKIIFFLLLIIAGAGITIAQTQEFKRNIEARTFVPKGQWIVGSSVE